MDRKRRKIIHFLPMAMLYFLIVGGGFILVLIESLGYIPAFQLNTISLNYYIDVVSQTGFLLDLFYSLFISTISTTLSLLIGTLLAFKLARSSSKWIKKIVHILLQGGMVIPYLYMIFLVMLLFSKTGLLSRLLFHLSLQENLQDFPTILYSPLGFGIVITYVLKGLPFVTLFLLNYMSNINGSYDQVAKSLGASEGQILRKIYIPLSSNLIVWASMVLFAYDYGAFEVPYIIGANKPQTLSIRLFSSYLSPKISDLPKTSAMSIILFITGICFIFCYAKILRFLINLMSHKTLFVAIERKRKIHTSKPNLIKKIPLALTLLFTIACIFVPLIYLLLLSFNSFFKYPSLLPTNFSLSHWETLLFKNPLFYKGIFSSLIVGGFTALLSTFIGFWTARGVAKYYNHQIHKALLWISIPLFIPGMSLFLGAHQLLIHTVFANKWFGIVLAHCLISLPYTTNIGVSYFNGIPKELEEIGTSLGAKGFTKFRKIIFPLIKPGLLLSITISFLISNTEYFSSFIIGGGNTITLSMIMYPYIANADYNMTSVSGIVFILFHLIVFIFLGYLLKQKVKIKALYEME